MPYLSTSQAFLEQSSLLLEAYPDTVRHIPTTIPHVLSQNAAFRMNSDGPYELISYLNKTSRQESQQNTPTPLRP